MSDKYDDVLELAINNNELDRFLVGEPFYFYETKDDNDDPQNVVFAFDQLLMPKFREGDDKFPNLFVQGLTKILADYPDTNRAIYMAQRWIWYYRYCMQKKKSNPDGPYKFLPYIDLSPAAASLKKGMEENKEELISDERWAGEAWNSKQGLWEPLVRTAIHIRDKLGGPDYVPSNA